MSIQTSRKIKIKIIWILSIYGDKWHFVDIHKDLKERPRIVVAMFIFIYGLSLYRRQRVLQSSSAPSWRAADLLRFPSPPRATSTARTAAHLYGRPVSRRLSLWLGRDECEYGVRARRTVTAARFKPFWRRSKKRPRNDCSEAGREAPLRLHGSVNRSPIFDISHPFFSLSLSVCLFLSCASPSDAFPGARARLIAYVAGKSTDIDRHSIFRSMSEGSAVSWSVYARSGLSPRAWWWFGGGWFGKDLFPWTRAR